MKKIPLTRGQFAIVDDEDFDWLNQWNWCCTDLKRGKRYAFRGIRSRIFGTQERILMHRQITAAKKGEEVDHINGNGIDNRKCNLRRCTHTQNLMNSKINSRNKSGFRGVTFEKNRAHHKKPWFASIRLNYRTKYLGRFASAVEAARKWNEVALEHYGQFAKLNQI